MSRIEVSTRTVYRAPTKGRTYLTARSAANAEAAAMMVAKYPTEQADYSDGRMDYPGYHWSDDPRLVVTQKRLTKLLLRKLRAGTTRSKETADGR